MERVDKTDKSFQFFFGAGCGSKTIILYKLSDEAENCPDFVVLYHYLDFQDKIVDISYKFFSLSNYMSDNFLLKHFGLKTAISFKDIL